MADNDVSEEMDRTSIAEEFKAKANECFKAKRFQEAIDYYTKAIDADPTVAAYYGNRSFSHLKMESYGYALSDANKALELDKAYVKGYYRRASANMALGKLKHALKDFETVKKVRPKDRDAVAKFNECSKIVRQQAFARAIKIEAEKSASESIDLQTMIVGSDYSGPRLDEDISAEFMSEMISWFKERKVLHVKYAFKIILGVMEILKSLPSLVDIDIPECNKFTVCGDIHGQFYDLLNIFDINGLPSPDNPYLFNGDFVDRGSFSVEVILTLFGFKLLYPKHFHMARGNHESETMNEMYGFNGEVKSKYTNKMVVSLFTEVFNWLPLAHCIHKKILVMHGGLFESDDVTLDDIRQIDRNRQPPQEGLMCELLWSDPQEQNGRGPSKRGVAIQFGPNVTKNFCVKNNLNLIIRSHEMKQDGYEVAHAGRCVTVFSAPNYCDQMGNKGAFITFGRDLKLNYVTYEAVPHPNVKPMQYASPLFGLLS